MFARAAAAIAIMKINHTLSSSFASAQEALRACLQFVLQVLTWVFLPHMALSAVIFIVAAVASYRMGENVLPESSWLLVLWGLLIFVFYGAAAFLYAVLTSGLFALRALSGKMEDFVYSLFSVVKEKIAGRINSMEEGLAKDQAKILLTSSLAEVMSELKRTPMRSVGAGLARVFLGLMSFVAKSVLIGRIMEISGATVSVSAVFASRVTLAGAIFLNMSLICTVFLWGLYLIGALVFGTGVWFVFAGK